jgi:hypothetical protein
MTRLFGYTRDGGGSLIGSVWIRYWSDDGAVNGWAMSANYQSFGSDTKDPVDDGNWEAILDKRGAREGTWHVCVVAGEASTTCLSNTIDATTMANCRPGKGVQVFWLDFRRN